MANGPDLDLQRSGTAAPAGIASANPDLSAAGTAAGGPGLATVALNDSWSTLDEEVALIDRLFGGEIAALFERDHDGERRLRG